MKRLQTFYRSAGGLILLAASVWFSVQGRAGTLVVTSAADAGPNTLRSAIQQANANANPPPGDNIIFGSGISTITISSGPMLIDHDMTISGPGAGTLTIVGANANDRVFEIQKNGQNGIGVTMSRLRFTGGYRSADGTPGTQANPNGQTAPNAAAGGIILNNLGCLLTLSNCVMEQCYAIGGNGGNGFGGILAPPGAGGDGAQGRGGAISTAGGLTLYGCTFRSNSVAGGNGGAGTNASTSFDGSKGGNGAGGYGGAIYVEYSGLPALVAVNCTFFENLALGGSGGSGGNALLAARAGNGGNGGPAEGGAVYHGAVNCLGNDCGRMTHCTVSHNFLHAGAAGAGGIGNINGTPGTDGASSGGGLFFVPTTYEIHNTIVAADGCIGTGACSGPDVTGIVASQGFNLIGATDNSTGWTVVAPGVDQHGTAMFPLDPRLGPLQNNGGETPTLALLEGSPAIDAGGPTFLPLDQRGQPRPVVTAGIFNGGDGSDIGAYELQCSLSAPPLKISRSGNNLLLSWPWPSRCFVLQQTSDLNMPIWVASTYAINVVGNENQVTVNQAAENLFFRLFRP